MGAATRTCWMCGFGPLSPLQFDLCYPCTIPLRKKFNLKLGYVANPAVMKVTIEKPEEKGRPGPSMEHKVYF
jgi:hypothetical protein